MSNKTKKVIRRKNKSKKVLNWLHQWDGLRSQMESQKVIFEKFNRQHGNTPPAARVDEDAVAEIIARM